MVSVEVLRVVAMVGIAVFHTFQPWFETCVGADPWSELEVGMLMGSPVALAVMGCIDQLGAWGNHVFFMISGCFLLQRAMEDGRPLGEQYRAALRRVVPILVTVALYVAIALGVSLVWPDATGASLEDLPWFAQALQFAWVYIALVLLCPLMGIVARRCNHRSAVLATCVVVIYTLNLYIAYVSPGETFRSILEWRKLMSAVTYALSFAIGGYIGRRRPSRRTASIILAACVVATVVVESYAAATQNLDLLNSLSYKSTSPLACAMAASSLACVLSLLEAGKTRDHRPQDVSDSNASSELRSTSEPSQAPTQLQHPRTTTLLTWCTSGMLGFYVLQSLFSRGWHQLSNTLLTQALQTSPAAFLLTGAAFSMILFTILLLADSLIRRPLLHRLS